MTSMTSFCFHVFFTCFSACSDVRSMIKCVSRASWRTKAWRRKCEWRRKKHTVFCELMKHIWNFQAQQGCNSTIMCHPCYPFFSMRTRPHVRHKRSVKILSLRKDLCFTCLAHLQCHCLHKTSLPALWMVPKVRRITGLWCRKSSLEGNPSRWPGESSISSTSSRLRWLRSCIVWLVWHLGDSFAKLAGLLD